MFFSLKANSYALKNIYKFFCRDRHRWKPCVVNILALILNPSRLVNEAFYHLNNCRKISAEMKSGSKIFLNSKQRNSGNLYSVIKKKGTFMAPRFVYKNS